MNDTQLFNSAHYLKYFDNDVDFFYDLNHKYYYAISHNHHNYGEVPVNEWYTGYKVLAEFEDSNLSLEEQMSYTETSETFISKQEAMDWAVKHYANL